MAFYVAVSGGKGGTGKSMVATNVAARLAERGVRVLLVDMDVEAPNDHILLGVDVEKGEKRSIAIFYPLIDYSKCTPCGACAAVCDTGAIIYAKGRPPFVMPRLCSGCRACLHACPYGAIREGARVIGEVREARHPKLPSLYLVSGVLREGEEHTPPAVVEVRRRALSLAEDYDVVIADTGAGTGTSVSVALQPARLLIAVTEPTPLGLHDLRAILEVARGMGLRTWLVVNKHGIGPDEEHVRLAREYGVERVFRVPFTRGAAEAYARGVPVHWLDPRDPAAIALGEVAEALEEVVRRG